MSLKYKKKYKPYLTKLIAVSLILIILVALKLFYHQIAPYSIALSLSQNTTKDQLSRGVESFNDFQIEIISTGQPLASSNLINIQVLLTVHAPVQDLRFKWALERDITVITSELPEDPISLEFQQTPIEYNIGIRINGSRPYLILHAYTLGPNGEKIGETAEIYFTQQGNRFFSNTVLQEPTIRIDPNEIKVIR